MRLANKVVLITGGSGGIGSATAVECAKEGAKAVYVTYFGSEERAAAAVKAIQEGGSRGYALRVDVGKKEDAAKAAETIVKAHGSIDAVGCFAGYGLDKHSWFSDYLELTESQVTKPLQIDVLGSVFTTQAVLPSMLERGRGSIVLVSSTPGLAGDTVGIAYAMGKAANSNLAKSLAQLYGVKGIRVNAIAPGSISTPANLAGITEQQRDQLVQETSLRRFGTPEEIAKLAVFLLSDDSGYLTGQTLVSDGGTVFS